VGVGVGVDGLVSLSSEANGNCAGNVVTILGIEGAGGKGSRRDMIPDMRIQQEISGSNRT
jgi:hypothetical protein